MFDATVPVYRKAMRSGHADHDTAAVCAVLEKMAGVKRKAKDGDENAGGSANSHRRITPSPSP